MRTLAAFAVLLLVAACQSAPPEMTEAEIAQIEADAIQEIQSRTDDFWEAVLSGDAETVASFWTSNALILEPGIRVAGDEIPTFLEEAFASATYTAYDEEVLDWFIHGDVAYSISSYDETFQVDGQEIMVRNYAFIRWEKVDGTWMIHRLVAGPRNASSEG